VLWTGQDETSHSAGWRRSASSLCPTWVTYTADPGFQTVEQPVAVHRRQQSAVVSTQSGIIAVISGLPNHRSNVGLDDANFRPCGVFDMRLLESPGAHQEVCNGRKWHL